jgi:hypothetical protein
MTTLQKARTRYHYARMALGAANMARDRRTIGEALAACSAARRALLDACVSAEVELLCYRMLRLQRSSAGLRL